MATDTVTLFNQALSLAGARNNVVLPEEISREAEECRLHFETIRDQILASAAWPEATKIRSLSLLSADEDGEWASGEPRPGYTYSYSLPSDCLRPQYLTTFNRFQVATKDDTLRVLMTNETTPILTYTYRQTNVTMWSPELSANWKACPFK
jgi:hypothetical protein